MRIRATITYEYDTNPDVYPEAAQISPLALARYDLACDPQGMIGNAKNLTAIMANEVVQ